MEMEMEVAEEMVGGSLLAGSGLAGSVVDRLAAAAAALEQAAERLAGRELTLHASTREAELERMLATAEAELTALRSGRKTQPAGVSLLAKDGGEAGRAVGIGAIDAALGSLSLEQRIAVKAQLMRSGLIG